MRNYKNWLLAAAITLFATGPAAADGPGRASSKTALTAAEEVQDPPVVSDGRAVAIITFNRRFRKANIRLNFSNLEGEFTRLHLHCNVAGANGPVAIGLIDLVALSVDNSETVTLDSNSVIGTLRNSQFGDADPCAAAVGRSITDLWSLAQAIDEGLIYWNLHTTAFPAGELRGQVAPLRFSRGDRDDD